MRILFVWAAAALLVCTAIGKSDVTTIPSTQEPPALSVPPPPPSISIAGRPTTQPATTTASQPPSTQPAQVGGRLKKVVVVSDLDLLRDQIVPSLGATQYTIGPDQINNIPGGSNATFQQVILRSPGVVPDSFGQFHIRGEHANATYDVDGVLLPQPINTFGQELDTRLIQSVTLIDGSLPAQYGFHTAGIIDVTSKTGAALQGGEVSLYGGSYDWFEPSMEVGWTDGKWDVFATGSYKHNSIGIENPTGSVRPIHDDTSQERGFIYAAYHIDDTSRITVMVNGANQDFQIPNVPGELPAFQLGPITNFDSSDLNETQNEQEYYGVISYQKSTEDYSILASAFYRYGQIHFVPDFTGDLILQGVAGEVLNTYSTQGFQIDSSYNLNDQHTLRAGLIGDYTVERNNTNSNVFTIDPVTGAQTSTIPEEIVDDTRNDGLEIGGYIQDEWKLTKTLTLNYGARLDEFDANFDNEAQISPRVNLVWKLTPQTTAHIGYARYFVPPPIQYVPPGTINKFVGTTNAAPNLEDGPPLVERSNYYDVGISQQITKPWVVNFDYYYKQAKNLVDLGQFGDAVIFTPFNYRYGRVTGADFSTTYKQDGLSLFGNFGWVVTAGKDIDSQQFTIDPAELSYIESSYIKLDHEAEYSASAGISYEWKDNAAYLDWIFSSGLRFGFANLLEEPSSYPVNIGYQHTFHVAGERDNLVNLRFDIINLFDEVYQIRSGTGIGVAAPQYGQRRTFLVGLSYVF